MTTTYTYDALNRITSAKEKGIGVNNTRNYEYDSLGNLVRVVQNGCDEYLYNGTELDQYKQCGVIPNSIGTSYWEYTYDHRGNLTGSDKYTRTTEGMKWQNVATYVYDETNRMVQGKNEDGEYSLYTYNGLGVRVGRELIMKDNTHGYTDFHDLTPSVSTDIDKPEVVKESYVVDYTTATRETLTMHEEGGSGFDYRWVHGLDRLSVKVTSEGTNWWGQNVKKDILKDYAHQDRMGSTTNMSDKFGRIVGRADYNEWGEITYKEELNITSAYRRIYPEANYTGHDWDDVLGMYYAKARFYDPAAKRFVSMDPVKGNVVEPLSLVSYIYCVDNPLKYVDPLGLEVQFIPIYINGTRYDDMVFDYEGKTYLSSKSSHIFKQATGIGKLRMIETDRREATGRFKRDGLDTLPVMTKIYSINGQDLYFEQFDCERGIALRDITDISGTSDVLSWWKENGRTNITLNTLMKDAPVKVVRSGNNVYIDIYARFTGDWNVLYDNYDDAIAKAESEGKLTDTIKEDEYTSKYTTAELVAMGVMEHWSLTVTPNNYNFFGDYFSLNVTTRFHSNVTSPNDIITVGNPTANQKYITVLIDTSTPETQPKDKNDPNDEISHTNKGKKYWSISNASEKTVTMYDHYFGITKDGEFSWSEYKWDRFKRTAAHEFGHVFGLSDIYTWPNVYKSPDEVLPNDMMDTSGIVSANDIEMLLQAWKVNKWQAFDGELKSSVIRTY